MMNRIALIVCYMGSFPHYFRYFSDSATLNSDIDFYIFSDQVSKIEESGNIKIVPLTLEQFNSLSSLKLGLNMSVAHGYKLCDLHPAYGVIFEDYLKSYDFWGHCDMDVLWGRISHFITEDLLQNFDVITAKENFIAGHFTLYRNSGIALELFRQTDDYKKVFTDGITNYHFDEACLRYGEFHSPHDLRQSGQTVSMSDIAMDLKQRQQIRLCMQNMNREYPDPFCYVYRDGIFTDLSNGQEFMYLHLNYVKNQWYFFIPKMDKLPSRFSVFPEGIIPALPEEFFPKFRWWVSKNWFNFNYLTGRLKKFGLSTYVSRMMKKIFEKATGVSS